MNNVTHTSVLFNESIEGLNISADGIYVDGTFGRGGHSSAIVEKLSGTGHLYAFDKDPDAIQCSEGLFSGNPRFSIAQRSFADIEAQAEEWGVLGQVDGIFLDLGVSSPQLDDAERGFSFLRDGPLDMRMDPSRGLSAAEWLAVAKAPEIAGVLKEYGEERYAKRIAGAIVDAGKENPITRTTQLADIVAEAHPAWEKHKHPATRSFQAIRIFINKELTDLETFLSHVLAVLKPGGRLAIISFHSLEDRIVKRFIQKHVNGDDFPIDLPITTEKLNKKLKKVGKLITPTDAELEANPRSRSGRLRIAEKL